MYFKLAWRNLWRNKRRSLITVSSIFFAVIIALFSNSTTTGAFDAMVNNIVSFSSGYIQIHKKGYWDERIIDNSFAENRTLMNMLTKHSDVIAAVPHLESFALASSGNKTAGVLAEGIDPAGESMISHLDKKLIRGSYPFAGSKDVLLGEGLADYLGLDVRDTLVLLGQGYHGATAAAKFAIAGIVKLPSPELSKRIVYIPLKEAQSMYSADTMLTAISLLLKEDADLQAVKNELKKSIDTTMYEIMDWKEMMPDINQFVETEKVGHKVTIWVIYLMISFGIFGTVLMMMLERMHEFGILIAIGMKKLRLAFVVFIEVVLISFTGIVTGVIGGIPLLLYFYYHPIRFTGNLAVMYSKFGMEPVLPMALYPSVFLSQVYVMAIITLLVSFYPFFKIIRIKISNVLHN